MDAPVDSELGRFSLKNRRILYTGAAGGLGLKTTVEMIAAGADVVVLDKNEQKIRELRAAVPRDRKNQLTVHTVDLGNRDALQECLSEVAAVGGVDVVINNAAIYPNRSFDSFSLDDFHQIRKINVDAGIQCVQAVFPQMREKNWGRIINVSSITVYGGWPNFAPYIETKAALVGLTRAWAREFGQWGITSNAIAPGAFPTDAEKIHPDPEGYSQFVLDHQSIKRRGNPIDIAGVLVFLASDASAFVTGQTINVDGGWVMN